MPRTAAKPLAALVALAALAASALLAPAMAPAAGSAPPEAPKAHAAAPATEQKLLASAEHSTPLYQDLELAREHEIFTSFARQQVERMNANIIGGKHQMRVAKGHDGQYHASYKAIDLADVVCQVRRAEHDPRYYVGVIIYKEQVLESRGQTAEACKNGRFQAVGHTAHRLIYSSKRGGGWN